ncbi:MAG: histidine kinase [Sphingobacteriales bacterium 17-39-43]|uniref:CBS domain-containing protein n=1 Tax=Daejeonella sp. TaxID=2805397 RepID=UPI000BDA1B49|nr:CBS domain-containing protein [Daejeonella sp.]MCF8451827.1 CBS domain-containing protein [Pedobacter sp.]OYZ28284.1 MAG: histidine kinase [Sphingobacteriales bacterium 16-39-50]OZA22044.1 MAG: histidine kinase [Sphingobacteriales bacterium 17-39-43]HQT24730.1 CBS domain-containing protein [Daejeonella sp.]HQT57806.1 CBS domain-containing protein [Daejeonella sp.]
MKTVRNILQYKSQSIYSVDPDTSVLDALKIMMDKNISALLVMEGPELKGIFTERDYARKIILQGKSSKETKIKEVMTARLEVINLNSSIDHCMQIMTDKHIRHLPIVDNGKVSGMISIGDLVKFVINDQKQTIEQLQNYISS